MKKVKKKKVKKRAARKNPAVKTERVIKRKRRKKALKGEVVVRDRSPAAKKPLNRRFGREILLNDEMLAQMILLWRYGVQNDRIAGILGIGVTALKTWLRDDRPVEVTLVDGKDKIPRKIIVGLKQLMEHEKENLKASYIQRLEEIIEEAKEDGDLKTASNNLRWIMEKMLPHVFGDPRYRPDGDPDIPKKVKFPLKPPSMD